MIQFIANNWQAIIGTIGIVIAWFVGDKNLLKNKVKLSDEEVDNAKLGNINANFKVYQELINDLEIRFKNRIHDLEEDLDKMKILTLELRKAVSDQETYIKKLHKKLESYEKLER
jgi:fido (protein-threonine AMPylation protein)